MPLPWVRLDANIRDHDKVLELIGERDGWRAYAVYTFSLGWAGGHGTDGYIPRSALPILHGTPRVAELLVRHRLWELVEGGWSIRNYAARQELAVITEGKRAAQRKGARMTNCRRRHGPDCGCWERDA